MDPLARYCYSIDGLRVISVASGSFVGHSAGPQAFLDPKDFDSAVLDQNTGSATTLSSPTDVGIIAYLQARPSSSPTGTGRNHLPFVLTMSGCIRGQARLAGRLFNTSCTYLTYSTFDSPFAQQQYADHQECRRDRGAYHFNSFTYTVLIVIFRPQGASVACLFVLWTHQANSPSRS